MVLTLEDMGFVIEASHHEVAPAQHEIDFQYDEALKTADNIMTFKLVVKTIAKRHGLHATFMPKPKFGVSGSGMHINMSLSRDGLNVFSDGADEKGLSREAYYFIGGLVKHMKAISFITNPIVNSYKRLIPGYEAPVYIAWSAKNRTPLLRVPAARGLGARVDRGTAPGGRNRGASGKPAGSVGGICQRWLYPGRVGGGFSEKIYSGKREGVCGLPYTGHRLGNRQIPASDVDGQEG